jgi:hypothetical protein
VIELPRALAAWAPQLELFPEEIALALGAAVAKLAQLVGAFSAGRAPEGEPDGYDGITQRGPYERLLPTQWLLLDELPDEFLRRVVAGEHAFLRRAHAGPAAQRRCFAAFDAGVAQLGAPRIGQLALLLVLAQRAQLSGATFEWGVLQDPARTVHGALSAAAVRTLLAARSPDDATAADVADWLAAQHGPHTSELWLVGSPRLAALAAAPLAEARPLARRTAFLSLADVLEVSSPQRLAVRAELPWRARASELSLELPDERLTARIMRDPFAPAAGRVTGPGSGQNLAQSIHSASALVFSPDGRRLYVRARDGGLVSLTVQGSLNAPLVRPSVFHPPAGQTIFAVSRYEKRTVALAEDGPTIVAHMLSKRGAAASGSYRFVPVEGYVPALMPQQARLRPIGVFSADHFGFVDDAGDVVELVAGKIKRAVAAGAITATAIRGRLVWAAMEGGVPRVTWAGGTGQYLAALEVSDSVARNQLLAEAAEGGELLHFHFGRPFTELVALSTSPGRWALVGKEIEWMTAPPPAEMMVVGVIEHPRDQRNGLLMLDARRKSLISRWRGAEAVLVTTRAEITAVAVSSTAHEIAYLTAAGELGVYSTDRGRQVLSLLEELPL